MDKKYVIAAIGVILVIIMSIVLIINNNINQPKNSTPYCNSAPIEVHYNIAIEYLHNNYKNYSIELASATETGHCNNGNTASTKFEVLENAIKVGEIIVNGDTNKVTFKSV